MPDLIRHPGPRAAPLYFESRLTDEAKNLESTGADGRAPPK